jgi:hypothetical protein
VAHEGECSVASEGDDNGSLLDAAGGTGSGANLVATPGAGAPLSTQAPISASRTTASLSHLSLAMAAAAVLGAML